MKTSLKKSALISTSLIISVIALSSCGRSKESKSAPVTAAVTTAPAQTTPQADGPSAPPSNLNQLTSADNTLAQPKDTRPNNNAIDNEVLPPLLAGLASDPAAGQSGANKLPMQPAQKETQQAYQINFKGQVAVKTGGQSNDLFYTSAGDDTLIEEFKSYNAKVAVNQQVMNNNLAKAISVAKLVRSATSNEISVQLTVDEFGVLKTYKLAATPEADKMKLSLSAKESTGEMEFQGGFLKCLDVGGGCEVAYAKIKLAGGYTRIIFRNSMSDMHFLLEENVTNNSGFAMWSKYILNAANALDNAQRIEALQLSSFEVVNGRAGMGALLTTSDREVVALSIPMVVSGVESEVRAPVTKVNDISKNFDFAQMSKIYSSNLSAKINEARLVNNNGRGQFKLQLQMGNENNSASVWIVAARIQKDTLSIEQLRAFESKLKAF